MQPPVSPARALAPSDLDGRPGLARTASVHDRSTVDPCTQSTVTRQQWPTPRGTPRQPESTTRSPSQPWVKLIVKRTSFAERPLYFCRFNPQSILIQSNYLSVLFLFTLDPVFSRFGTRSPITMSIYIFNCFNSKIGSVYLQNCHYILFYA